MPVFLLPTNIGLSFKESEHSPADRKKNMFMNFTFSLPPSQRKPVNKI